LKIFKSIYTSSRFYWIAIFNILLFILGYFFDPVFLMAKIMLLVFIATFFIDFNLLFLTKRQILLLSREVPERMSNGDDNDIYIYIKNNHFFPVWADIIDEIPEQFQKRDFIINTFLKPSEEKKIKYSLRPVERGEYIFGKTNTYISTILGLIKKRQLFDRDGVKSSVYPSFLSMKKYEFLAISNKLTEMGIKKIRRLGLHSEFDQIKNYVKGDSYRAINWKATAKKAKLMVNQYQDERSQQIYNIIDMGRLMQFPFEGMSLLDYAINASLILSNTALNKHDKTGLITFNTKIDTFFRAERKNRTIFTIMEMLYKQETKFLESNFELLYINIKKKIPNRSLLILFTNFESLSALERQIFFMKNLSGSHLLLVIFFENTELKQFAKKHAESLEEIYINTLAEKFIYDKHLIVKELNKHGIHCILTEPGQLTAKLVNKYLELKDLGLI